MAKTKVQICETHLSQLYEAMQDGDLQLMEKIEHELTNDEKCVACAYLFKTHGTVRQALEAFLNSEGFEVESTGTVGIDKSAKFWTVRLLFLGLVFAFVFAGEAIAKQFLFGKSAPFFSVTILEATLICVMSFIIFLLLDDIFFD